MNPSNPNAGEPVNPNGTVSSEPAGSSVNPLSNLESVVAAAQQAAAAQQTPKAQFENQFGSGATPPVAEVPADAPIAQSPQVVETVAPEQTPAEKLKKQIAVSIDAFLEEAAREKTPV